MKKQMAALQQNLEQKKHNDTEEVKRKFAELQNRFLDEIKELNQEKIKVKEQGDKEIENLNKEKDALNCKIQLLEASIHEESRISINKISNLKLKQLSSVKQVEERDMLIESLKKEKKDMKLKASSQR